MRTRRVGQSCAVAWDEARKTAAAQAMIETQRCAQALFSVVVGRAMGHHHPPLQGEGRTAGGSPGWGDSDASCVAPLSPPPGPLARADLPPPGGGGANHVICDCFVAIGEGLTA